MRNPDRRDELNRLLVERPTVGAVSGLRCMNGIARDFPVFLGDCRVIVNAVLSKDRSQNRARYPFPWSPSSLRKIQIPNTSREATGSGS